MKFSCIILIVWFSAWLLGLAGCASAPPPSSPAEAAAQKVHEVLGRWIDAQGGRRRLAAVHNAQCFIRIEEGTGHNFIRTIEAADGGFRYEIMAGPDNTISGGYENGQGWQDGGSWGGGVYRGQRGDPGWSSWFLRALQMEDIFPVRRLLPDEKIDGHVCAVLGLKPEGKPEERWYFDRQSGQLLRAVKSSGAVESVYSYSDYRTFSRIQIPFTVTVTSSGQASTVYQRLSIKTDVAIKPGDFSPTETLIRQAREIDDLLKRNIEGGALAGAESKSILVHATILSATSGITTDLTVHRRKPGMVLVEKESAGLGRTLRGFDGVSGWENSEILGYHILKESELNDLMSLSWLGSDPYLRERFPFRSKLGETTLADRKTVKLRLRTFSGLFGIFYFDKENARLLRWEMEANPAAGARALRVDYSDYREVGAGWLPFRVTYESDGSQTVISCRSVELDVDMPDALFRPPTEIE